MKLKEVARRCKMCWYVPSEPFDNLGALHAINSNFSTHHWRHKHYKKECFGSPNFIIRNLPISIQSIH